MAASLSFLIVLSLSERGPLDKSLSDNNRVAFFAFNLEVAEHQVAWLMMLGVWRVQLPVLVGPDESIKA